MRTALIAAGLALMLMVPTSRAAWAQEAPADAPTYIVKEGDTLYSISRRYGLTVEAVQRLNDLRGTTIRPGQVLVVGRAEAESEPEAEAPPEAETPPETEVPPRTETPPETGDGAADAEADTAAASASLPDTAATTRPDAPDTVAPDTAATAPDSGRIRVDVRPRDAPRDTSSRDAGRGVPGDRPVGAPNQDSLAASARVAVEPIYGQHAVQAGETLYGVAARYGLSTDTLRALNDDVPTFLEQGATLRLPPSEAKGVHRVAEGETIYDVAAEYGVSVRALQSFNDLEQRAVQAGQYLRIPGPRDEGPPPAAERPADARGPVVRYPEAFEGRLTASGRPYDPQRFVVSHRDLPLGALVLLTNPETGRSTFAEVADRGPLEDAFLMDVSDAVAEQLGLAPGSEQPIEVRIIDRAAP